MGAGLRGRWGAEVKAAVYSEQVEAAVAELRRRRQRITPARVAVLRVLDETTGHLDASAVVDRAAQIDARVHRATIYRALSTLSEIGIVVHTHVADSGAVYHLHPAGEEAHAHLRCRTCKKIVDLPAKELTSMSEVLDRDYGFCLEPEHAALLGQCANCRSRS